MYGFRATFERLRRRLVRRGATHEDAEDFIQEAFLRLTAYQAKSVVHEPEAFLTRTALNLATDEARRRGRRRLADRPVEDMALEDSSPLADEVLHRRQRLERLTAGLADMDPTTRSMLMGQRLDGRALADIAREHGVSVSAVEKRIARGLLFLMRWMEGW